MKKSVDPLEAFLGPQGPLNNEKYWGGVYRGNRGKGVDTGGQQEMRIGRARPCNRVVVARSGLMEMFMCVSISINSPFPSLFSSITELSLFHHSTRE